MAITFKHVTHTYQADGPLAYTGLSDISFQIKDGSFTSIIGQTGSGKSTLVQHMNALLKPTAGAIQVGSQQITPETKNKHLKKLRQEVGMVFQLPEQQLFAETVVKDISFGPQNFGIEKEEAEQLARQMLEVVGLPTEVAEQSPFDLSGGQMRRVAIAGVLASKPKILILDEPTAGLDPKGHVELMKLFAKLHQNGTTIVLISHQMEDVAQYSDQILVMDQAHLIADDTPQEIFSDLEFLQQHHLDQPESAQFAQKLMRQGFNFTSLPITEAELVKQLLPQLQRRN
ncbi:energy-coupling factor transporter ATPase [Bombilactobacillus folatiphilus]|uniref:Energy-coupling factor transporter ATP-binding protein EcfA2 n=1 Tax=Bombilactobacillus folatiphilus TaxID=2923362 RepID=A0ABY4P9N0_9LACO|nr:energy-coupling factor transporter ATPase [Bombilactobacillus folatiphilus]UQS82382.1 energy-coupling factor transporter ATPase [Bombilactobacillus folatiphilus]